MPFWVERTDNERRAHPMAVAFGVPLAFLAVLASSIPLVTVADAAGLDPIKTIFAFISLSQLVFLVFPKLLLAANLFATSLCLIAARLGWVGGGACLIIGAFGAITFNFGLYVFLTFMADKPYQSPLVNVERSAEVLAFLGGYGALIGFFYWIWLRWLQPRAFINRVQGKWA